MGLRSGSRFEIVNLVVTRYYFYLPSALYLLDAMV